ncbi:LCP family protein [Pseudonocardia hispaniensis]|uniref:LCP family protein n=1 Tax=Pseudonocardia hispaniensis TaxID=904933 RepID=A0ABW1J8U4_9PSEU
MLGQRARAGVWHRPAIRWWRIVLASLSALTLVVTGYGWSLYRQLDGAMVTSDVLGGVRGADGATDILLVGLDSRTDARGNPLPADVLDALHAGADTGELNTDTLILVRIPNDPTRTATAVSIPRDSYVDIPGYGTHKINSAYPRAANTERGRLQAEGVTGADLVRRSSLAGRRALIATVEQLTGASIDHYAEVNLAGFAEITAAVGGVPVCLTAPANDPFSGADFPAGPQTLQGPAALAFVRQRHGLPRGDLDRVVRQQAFLASLAHQVLSTGTLTNPAALSGLIGAASRYVVLDQGWDLMAFAAQLQGLATERIQFRTMPTGRPDLRTPADGVAVQVDPALVHAFFADLGGVGDAADSGRRDSGGPATSRVTVDVRNGTQRTGLAAATQDFLDNSGYVPGVLGNAAPRTRSAVRATAADQQAAHRIAQLLGGLPVQREDSLATGRVEVLLGRDYVGPGTSDRPRIPAPPPGDDAPHAQPDPGRVITANGVPCVN